MPVDKKKTAAMAAVSAYLMEEQTEGAGFVEPVHAVLLWPLAGRQDIMSLRALVTARLFR